MVEAAERNKRRPTEKMKARKGKRGGICFWDSGESEVWGPTTPCTQAVRPGKSVSQRRKSYVILAEKGKGVGSSSGWDSGGRPDKQC